MFLLIMLLFFGIYLLLVLFLPDSVMLVSINAAIWCYLPDALSIAIWFSFAWSVNYKCYFFFDFSGDENFLDVGLDHTKAAHFGYISPKLHELLQIFLSFG